MAHPSGKRRLVARVAIEGCQEGTSSAPSEAMGCQGHARGCSGAVLWAGLTSICILPSCIALGRV